MGIDGEVTTYTYATADRLADTAEVGCPWDDDPTLRREGDGVAACWTVGYVATSTTMTTG
jgi:hypothetical protein